MAAPCGIVLAGGLSSRMGRPKAWLPFEGRPLVAHVVSALREVFAEVLVVAARGQDLPGLPGVTVVRDSVPNEGPARAIHDGLASAAAEAAFVTSCDAALLDTSLVAHLVSRIEGYDVVVPHWNGRFQPLHAVYRSTVLPVLGGLLARGLRRPAFLFDLVRTCRVDEEEIRLFDAEGESFANINTLEDYAQALERREEIRAAGRAAGPVPCTVELFGVPRSVAGTSELGLLLPGRATLSHLFAALAERLPALVGPVVSQDGSRLAEGCACNLNGLAFVRSASAAVRAGDRVIILSADAGG